MDREMSEEGREQPPREPADSKAQARQGPEHGEEQAPREPDQEAGHPVDGRLRVYLHRRVDAAEGRMKAAGL